MNHLRAFFAAALLSALPLCVNAAEIRDVNVDVRLDAEGAAHITEIWELEASSGTEMYLVRENLGDITFSDVCVTDETGRRYIFEENWDVDRSLSQKAGRCGIHYTSRGIEICWGLGSYGSHTYTVSYVFHNAVKSLQDYDMLHLQLVSPGLSSPPEHVRVVVGVDGKAIDEENARVWGFGYDGTMAFLNGVAIGESESRFRSKSSVIVLLRLDKGIIASPCSKRDVMFDEVLEQALEGSSFRDDIEEESLGDKLLSLLSVTLSLFVPLFGILYGGKKMTKRQRKKILGVDLKDISWSRDLPFKGDILESEWVLSGIGEDKKKHDIAAAFILRMLKNGQLSMSKDRDGKIEISFNDKADISSLPEPEQELYAMMKDASGSDVILQDKEFSRWSKKSRNRSRILKWSESIKRAGASQLVSDGWMQGGNLTIDGQEQARGVVGFKKYLQDYTLLSERQSREVALWQDYLVFAALYGIADQVSKELKDINPEAFDEVMMYDYATLNDVLYLSRNLAYSITNAAETQKAYNGQHNGSSRGGFGGFSSFGGGGGFSGGGFGGGVR